MSRGRRERVRNGAIWHFVLKEREREMEAEIKRE